jgi:hypothetical protein
MPKILLSINCFNRFHGGGYFPRWWEHVESMVVKPYRGALDVAVYDDGSADEGMVDYLVWLKSAGRVDWLTLGPRRGPGLPLARHAFGNAGYAYSLSGWPEHEFVLHFDTDVWFVRPEEDRGLDWLGACVEKLRADPRAFAASLWGGLWSNGASYRDDKPPSWFHLRTEDPVWVESDFFSTRMFLARARELEAVNLAALTEVGRRGTARRRRLVGRIDSYERLAYKNEICGKRHIAILRRESGVVTRHLNGPHELAWAEEHLGIRSVPSVGRPLGDVMAEMRTEQTAEPRVRRSLRRLRKQRGRQARIARQQGDASNREVWAIADEMHAGMGRVSAEEVRARLFAARGYAPSIPEVRHSLRLWLEKLRTARRGR